VVGRREVGRQISVSRLDIMEVWVPPQVRSEARRESGARVLVEHVDRPTPGAR
jgi:hypothetical protein